ncbi:unnamed protein product, partial [Ilex paraguariensis]
NTQTNPGLIHAKVIKTATTDHSLHNTLITLYAKSNLLSDALNLFRTIPSPNVVSWTALISAYSNSQLSLLHFVSMLRHPTLPNQRTLASLLKTCASLPSLCFGLQLHSLSIKLSLSAQPITASALVSFYCQTHFPYEGCKVLDEMSERDEVCYSTVIGGLAQNAKPIEALEYFANMRRCDLQSNMYSVSGALSAVSELAALEQCRIIHEHAVVVGLDLNVIVGSALVDGYGKCGLVVEARRVFDELMPWLNLIGWNSMMAGYAQQGDKSAVIELFGLMEGRGLVPDKYSFLAVLTVFYNAGLAEEVERVGRLVDAEKIALAMPFEPDAAVWRVLLSTCAYHAYVIVANVFAAVGRMDEVKEVRKLMKDRKVRKEGGRSWIEVHGQVHIFLAGDRTHGRTDEIYTKLAELMEEIEKLGYVPVWDEILHEVKEPEKREALWYHSEKLALTYGVLSGAAPPGKALRIVKNLRICRDCHEAFKYFSRVAEREILVRDVNRYHRFLDGSCTCGDYW